jgi:hypothetical protein
MTNDYVHVIPVNDLMEHEENKECACKPTVEVVEREDGTAGWLISHNALDGREVIEEEATRRYPPEDGAYPGVDRNADARHAFILGARWQKHKVKHD